MTTAIRASRSRSIRASACDPPCCLRRALGRPSASRSPGPGNEILGQRLARGFRRKARENRRNSVRRPTSASLTDRIAMVSVYPEAARFAGDCLVELRGFELMAIAWNDEVCRGFWRERRSGGGYLKVIIGRPGAATRKGYLPASLRVHSLSSKEQRS